jgi:CO/xanthine dehydrogenase FAD-binding subunit
VRRVSFHRAETLEHALELRARFGPDGTVVAGGTDLLVALRFESRSSPVIEVVDLAPIASMRGIAVADGTVRLGALATHADLESDAELRRVAPLLGQAAATVGSPQIRNRGTIGGNIANAAACADTLPPLVALGATLTLRSARGTREVAAAEFVTKPYETLLREDEIVTAFSFPALAKDEVSAFVKLGRRNALSISRLSVAVIVRRLGDGALTDVRIAGGSVAPTVRRFPEAEACLAGSRGEEDAIVATGAALAAAMIRESGRRWSTPYKEPVVQAIARRAVRAALEARP